MSSASLGDPGTARMHLDEAAQVASHLTGKPEQAVRAFLWAGAIDAQS